jgi:hypothetical protein
VTKCRVLFKFPTKSGLHCTDKYQRYIYLIDFSVNVQKNKLHPKSSKSFLQR